MNRFAVIAVVIIAALSLPAFAGHVTASSGYSVEETTVPGTVRGFDVLANGNYVVLEGSNMDYSTWTETTRLYQARPDGTQVGGDLYQYSAPTYGSFARIDAGTGKVYFGESVTGTVKSVNLDGTGATDVMTADFNYEMAVNSLGQKMVVAGSDVVMLGETGPTTIVSGATRYSGPLCFDSTGNLYVGTAGNPGGQSILKWTAAQVAAAAAGNPLAASDATSVASGLQTISGIDAWGSDLFYSEDSWTGPWQLKSLNRGLMASSDDWLGAVRVDSATGDVFVSVGNTIAAVRPVVPEPSSLIALILGAGTLIVRKRRS